MEPFVNANSVPLFVSAVALLIFQTNRRTTTADRVRMCTKNVLDLRNLSDTYSSSRCANLEKQVKLFQKRYKIASIAVYASLLNIFFLFMLLFGFQISSETFGINFPYEIKSLVSFFWLASFVSSLLSSFLESRTAAETLKEEVDFVFQKLNKSKNVNAYSLQDLPEKLHQLECRVSALEPDMDITTNLDLSKGDNQ